MGACFLHDMSWLPTTILGSLLTLLMKVLLPAPVTPRTAIVRGSLALLGALVQEGEVTVAMMTLETVGKLDEESRLMRKKKKKSKCLSSPELWLSSLVIHCLSYLAVASGHDYLTFCIGRIQVFPGVAEPRQSLPMSDRRAGAVRPASVASMNKKRSALCWEVSLPRQF